MVDTGPLPKLIAEYFERVERGEALDIEDFVLEHPGVADALREHLAFAPVLEQTFSQDTVVPEALGEFRILEQLGSGGMGTVYRAEPPPKSASRTAGAHVAVKVIHPHLLRAPGFFKRFLREAELGRRVAHENVVRTLDMDALECGGHPYHFLVMEYVEGQTLRELLDELERVPEALCRHIGREVAKGLAAIHAAGAVHRDLKPENVLITEDHVVKIMDLGVARLVDEAIRLSQTGAFVGSLEYAAPEQLGVKAEEVDGRVDLHALGLLLYELGTGRHPYRDDDARKVLRRLLDEEPRRMGEVNPQLSPFCEEVVHKLLAKDRDERFASAIDVLEVLEQGEAGPWWEERTRELRTQTRSPLRRMRIPRETALYGRDQDLAKLRALFEHAKAGEGHVLLVEGEAGIGKSRLVDEFVAGLREAGEDLNYLFGSYPPGGAATSSGAFSEAYGEHFGQAGSAAWLERTPLLVPAFDAVLCGEPPPEDALGLTSESLATCFVHATRRLAAERASIVLIDDLHFASVDSRALFMALARAVPGHRILLIGTMRPGVPEDWVANLSRQDHASHLALSRLGAKDLARLLEDAFQSQRLAEKLGIQIARKSDGNPFFAFEIIRGLQEGQLITQKPDGTWVTTQIIRDIRIPSSVMDLIQARLSDLSDEERNLLEVASCCGYEFDPQVVSRVLGMSPVAALQALGRIEKRHRLVRSTGRELRFDHHQVQEAMYAGALPQLREHYHRAIAEALEEREKAVDSDPKELGGRLCVELCEHFLRGGKGTRALRYFDAGLEHLESCYLNAEAVALAERMLAAPDVLVGRDRLRLLHKMNTLLELLGRREEQEDVLAHALAWVSEAGDQADLLEVERARGQMHLTVGRLGDAKSAFRSMLAMSREMGDRRGEGIAVGNLGQVFFRLGRFDEAEAHLERWLQIAHELGDLPGEARGESNLGALLTDLGRLEEAERCIKRSLEIVVKTEDPQAKAIAHHNVSTVLVLLDRPNEAEEHLRRSLAISREIGCRQTEGHALGNLGSVEFILGRYATAKDHLEVWIEISREIGDKGGEATAMNSLAAALLALGRSEEARGYVDRSLAIARESGTRRAEGGLLSRLGAIAQEQGDETEALALAKRALALRREVGDRRGEADSLTQLGELCLRGGDLGGAGEALRGAVDLLRGQQRKASLAHVLALLACLPEGDADAAQAALSESAGGADRPDTRYYLWLATGDPSHLANAKRLLDYRVEHAPEEDRESMLKNVRVNREIMEAWSANP